MNPERWRLVESLCHEALLRPAEERAGFLDAACTGDADLRSEIESLLRYSEHLDDLLDRPTGDGVKHLVRELTEPNLVPGTQLGQYRIETLLGEGGMGRVYRALDTLLGRVVALKFVHGLVSAEGFSRLVDEARAAARLDHPNICSIYEVVEDDDRCFIVMQYVEGETLANRIADKSIDVDEALEIAIQIAEALNEAHTRGIIHRDVKPQNIIITPRGTAKVLDFGLAKSVAATDAPASELQMPMPRTEEGLVFGTVAYMSPEQLRGQELDFRADLFALAVVLFEMSTGVLPFQGSTVPLAEDAIVHDAPTPPREMNSNLPVELERIILKGLEKDRELRYQSAEDLLADLRRLRAELKAGQPVPRTFPRRRYLGYAATAATLTIAIGAFESFRSVEPRSDLGRIQYEPLTNFTDSATSPAVSPDGRRLAFIRGPSTFLDPGQLYVKSLPGGEPTALTRDSHLKMSPVFSPDGSRITYTVLRKGDWETWVVSVSGGEPQLMLSNAAAMTWIGGRRLLFSAIKQGVHMAVVMGTENRSEIRDVYLPPTETGMAHRSYLSPDGKWVLIASEMNTAGWLPCRIVPAEGAGVGRIVGPPRSKCTYAAWSPDGRWMYFSADDGGGFHTWRQRFPEGDPEQFTFGTTDEEGIALWPDGRSFATSVGITVSSLWVHDHGSERQITSEGYALLPSFSADGRRLYYLLRASGVQQWVTGELWAFDLSTARRKQLLPGISMAHYEVSDDGSRVVFVRTDPGKEGVWTARVDSPSPPVPISLGGATRAFFGPAGTLLFQAEEGRKEYVFLVLEDGSGRRKVMAEPVIDVISLSPNRRWVVVWTGGSEHGLGRPMVAYPVGGGDPVRLCEDCADSTGPERGQIPPVLSWSRDGVYLYLGFDVWEGAEAAYRAGKTYALRLEQPGALPLGFKDEEEIASLPGVEIIPRGGVFAGPTPALYAYTSTTTHRNIYRIPIPRPRPAANSSLEPER